LTSQPQEAKRSSRTLVLRRVVRPDARLLRELRESDVEAFGDLGLRACDLAVTAEAGMVLVAYVEEERVGGCQLIRMLDEPECFFVVGLYLRPEWQGRSLGEALVEAVADEARKAGARSLVLAVAPDNAAAVRTYEKAGFFVEESVEDLYGNGERRELLRRRLAE